VTGSDTYLLVYDAENRLVEVKKNGSTIATFVYDGDGKRVKSVMGSETILFVGGHYEVTNPGSGQTVSKFYFAGASRIAMRKYTIPQNMTVEYLLGDHLGSTSITTDANGNKVSEMRYKAWGEVRYSWTDSNLNTTPIYALTQYTFTGQYSNMSDFGLMFYNARWYDPATGRFTSADTIIPPNVQGLDRYAYVYNSPLNYIDPSGHCSIQQGTYDGTLDCTANNINSATMEHRLGWFKGLIGATGREEWFANIVGILEAFIEEGLGESNSWISWTDSGILESIQNGFALFQLQQTNGHDEDMAWKDFFSATNDGERKVKWGAAENLGTQYGLRLAEKHGAVANEREQWFLNAGNDLYRDLLQSGEIEEFYGQLAADVASVTCVPSLTGICNYSTENWRNIGTSFGAWFGDPRSTDPIFGKAPVYYIARLILDK